MLTPVFNSLVLDLSKQVFDARAAIGESDANHDYPESLLVLALNRGCRDFLNALVEKESTETIIKAVPEYIKEVALPFLGGLATRPSDAIKGLTLKASVTGGEALCVWIPPDKFYATDLAYNPEETGNSLHPRWTEYGQPMQVKLSGLSPFSGTYLYIKTHDDIVPNVSNDILLNQRFHNQLLDLASAYIEKLSPVN